MRINKQRWAKVRIQSEWLNSWMEIGQLPNGHVCLDFDLAHLWKTYIFPQCVRIQFLNLLQSMTTQWANKNGLVNGHKRLIAANSCTKKQKKKKAKQNPRVISARSALCCCIVGLYVCRCCPALPCVNSSMNFSFYASFASSNQAKETRQKVCNF